MKRLVRRRINTSDNSQIDDPVKNKINKNNRRINQNIFNQKSFPIRPRFHYNGLSAAISKICNGAGPAAEFFPPPAEQIKNKIILWCSHNVLRARGDKPPPLCL